MPADPPRVLAVLPSLDPSMFISVIKPLVRLHEAGRVRAWITLEWQARPRDLAWADLLVFCRNVDRRGAGSLETAIRRRIPFLYDLDDNFFDLPPESDAGRYYLDPDRQERLTRYLTHASLVRVYAEPVAKRVWRLNPQVEQTFAPVDLDLIASPKAHGPSDPVRIVYATSRLKDRLSNLFLPALRRVLERFPGRVEAHFWGPRPAGCAGLRGIYHHPMIAHYDRFLRRFSAAGFDIGLAPLADDLFHRSKTNNKFREYGACRIAGIYSNVEVYASCVRDRETGLLVSNDSESWFQAIVRLVEDAGLRARIQRQARAYVEEHHSQDHFEERFLGQIERILGDRAGLSVWDENAAGSKGGQAAHGTLPPSRVPRMLGILRKVATSLRGQGLGKTCSTIASRCNLYGMLFSLQFHLWSRDLPPSASTSSVIGRD
jgi:glycosyltransferase involved in cell wall biosynthesis